MNELDVYNHALHSVCDRLVVEVTEGGLISDALFECADKIKNLQKQNKILRDAVEFVVINSFDQDSIDICSKALTEIGEMG